MDTIKSYLNGLPEPYKKKAIAYNLNSLTNLEHPNYGVVTRNYAAALQKAFNFKVTTEGEEYWRNAVNILLEQGIEGLFNSFEVIEYNTNLLRNYKINVYQHLNTVLLSETGLDSTSEEIDFINSLIKENVKQILLLNPDLKDYYEID